MIVAHLGVAAAAGGRWTVVPLLSLVAAAIAPDLLDIAYAVAGVCSPYGLYSHTIPAAALTGSVLGGVAYLATGSRVAGLLVAGLVLAHLPLDFVTGRKIYWPGGPLMGLDVYQRPLLDFLVEVPVMLAGWWQLRRSGKAPRWASLGVVAAGLALIQGTFDVAHRTLKPSGCRWDVAARP